MNQPPPCAPDDWLGSFYELCIELQPAGDDVRLRRALAALWRAPLLEGVWTEQEYQHRVTADAELPLYGRRQHGLLRLPGLPPTACIALVVREGGSDDPDDEPPPAPDVPFADWLDLCIPMGMLERVFPVIWPLEVAANPWLTDLNDALVQLAEAVYIATSYNLALIGEEISGMWSEHTIPIDEVAFGGVLTSPALDAKVRPASRIPVQLSSGLNWYAYTHGTVGLGFGPLNEEP
jgi:hypothetical protein